MELIDTHCHLTSDAFADTVDTVIERALAAGVRQMITVGTDAADARAALALAQRRAELRMAAGIHPHEAAKASPHDVEGLQRIWAGPLCVAVGEVGLDYHYDFSPRDTQRDLFARQLDAGAATRLPIIVHSREAHADVVAILRRCGYEGRPVVFHCFTGTADEAAEIAACGWRVSFSGVVTFKKSKELQRIAAACPTDNLMLETDSPYLSPEPVRHIRPNEPAHVAHVARFLAALRRIPPEDLAAHATRNSRAFFALPPAGIARA
jgi:TatD DNase family protein